jgi:hypothetical protein
VKLVRAPRQGALFQVVALDETGTTKSRNSTALDESTLTNGARSCRQRGAAED